VEAPAGCGKTELITECVKVETPKPILVLTHTTAGVAALRQRLRRDNVPSSNYRLNTIAGWALKIVDMFPDRAGHRHDRLAVPDYIAVQSAVGRLCQSGHINRELSATYSRLLVDEYQDCSASQHAIVTGISTAIPTVVFGDPLQAIFGFHANDQLANWNQDVVTAFPLIGRLTTPWRWNNVGARDLGNWLLRARTALLQGQRIDLRTCANWVNWHRIGGNANDLVGSQVALQFDLSRRFPNHRILIIGDSRNAHSRHAYASRSPGVNVVEPVDFRDILGFANQMNEQLGRDLLQTTITFLSTVMTNVRGNNILARVDTIVANRNRTPPTIVESAAISLGQNGGYAEAVAFMNAMREDPNRRIYRGSAFSIMLKALSVSAENGKGLTDNIALIREKSRHAGRTVPMKAVGSTLLLKGLEADHVVILDADQPGNAMTRENLYVALSRGARSIHIFSRSPVLP
jgi:DNA helicase-2/ATP-dependent DNA helicase PcrA